MRTEQLFMKKNGGKWELSDSGLAIPEDRINWVTKTLADYENVQNYMTTLQNEADKTILLEASVIIDSLEETASMMTGNPDYAVVRERIIHTIGVLMALKRRGDIARAS